MLTNLTIEQIWSGIKKKEFSIYDLISAYYENYKKYRGLNVHISEYWDEALERAKNLNQPDHVKFPMMGLPIAVKDLILTKGQRTTAASKILENFIAPYESFITQKLQDSQYIMPFKTNLDEFAMGSSNETSVFGFVANPWILDDRIPRSSGGSSGGSAAAVAAHMTLGALGTCTSGSIRQPAAFCGVVGIKPTYGRCSRRGIVAYSSSFDHPGVFARNVQDAAILLETISGHDPGDATSLNAPVPKMSAISGNVKGKRIGVMVEGFNKMPSAYQVAYNKLLNALTNQGAIVQEIDLPISILDSALRLYCVLSRAEATSNLARYDGIRYGTRGEGETYIEILNNTRELFGAEVKRRLLIGNLVLQAEDRDKFFIKATQLKAEIIHKTDQIFEKNDVILMPTTPNTAFPVGAVRDPIDMYMEDLYTVLPNIHGGPCLQLPLCLVYDKVQNVTPAEIDLSFLPTKPGLPMGLQVFAARQREDLMIEISKKIEEIIEWKGYYAQ